MAVSTEWNYGAWWRLFLQAVVCSDPADMHHIEQVPYNKISNDVNHLGPNNILQF